MRKHLYTIALVCLVVLAAWWAGWMPAQAQVVSGNNGSGNCGLSHWANLPVSPPALTCYSIPDAASCTAGTAVTTSGSTPCQLTWTGSNWLPAGNVTSAAAGGLTSAGNNLTVSGSTVLVQAPITVANGGTNAIVAGPTAANNIGAAALGVNSDITQLTGLTTPLSIAQGGTGGATGSAATTNIGALAVANNLSDLNSASTARTNLGLGSAATINAPVSVANGGTGTSSPAGLAGTGMSVSGTFPNQTYTLQTPVTVAHGGTNATAAGATAANNIGALAEASNLSDVASAATSRTNLGLGSIATVNSPVPVANGGTNATSAGATAANNIGALAEASNLSDLASASTARTNLGLGSIATVNSPVPAANGGTGTTYGATGAYIQKTNASGGTTTNSLYTTNSSQQAVNVTAGSISGALGICDSGCGTSGTGTFFSGPGDHLINFDGGVTAKDYVGISASVNGDATDLGATLPTGTELIGQVDQATASGAGAYTVFFYGPDFPGTGGGGVNTPTQVGNPGLYNSSAAIVSAIGAEINIRPYISSNPSDPLQAALGACPQITWVASTSESVGNMVADSNGDTEYVEACSGSCTTKTGTHPTWPTSAIANVGTQTIDNSGANQVTWEMIALGKYTPSGPCTVIGNSNDTYPIPNAVIISTGTAPVYLVDHGADYNCTETGGNGHACIVEGNLGHIVGNGQGSASDGVGIGNGASTSLDSDVEGLGGYLDRLPTNPITNFKQTGFDIRNIDVLPGGSAINKAALWIPGVEGQGRASRMYVGGGGPSGITDVLVDDTVQSWNGIHLDDLWVGMAGAAIGIDVECGTHGGSGMVMSGDWIVDPSNNSATWIKVNGSGSANCVNGHILAPYLEGAAGSSGTGLLLNDAQSWTTTAMQCLSGTETNCVSITGLEADLHVDGFNGNATNAVNDTDYGYTNTSQGSFVYAPPVNGATLISNNIPVSSTHNITMNPLINKYTISGNATFTFAKAAGGNDGFFATANAPVTFGFEVCQGTGGNFTETFNNPSGGTLYWTGGAQPGYTLTQGNGDFYQCFYNGTNAYCKETMSNVPCA